MIEPDKAVNDSIEQVTYLITLLSESYDLLHHEGVDKIASLGEAVDALIFANGKLVERKELREKEIQDKQIEKDLQDKQNQKHVREK